jgi:hypothetical protein
MTVLPPEAISITDGAIVIAAETVAPRLGLDPEALQAGCAAVRSAVWSRLELIKTKAARG